MDCIGHRDSVVHLSLASIQPRHGRYFQRYVQSGRGDIMKKLLVVLLFIPLFCSAQWSNEQLNRSFLDHTLTCTLVSFSASAVTKSLFPKFEQSWAVGIVAGMAVGLFHEFLESTPDQLDLVGDLVGSCIGVSLTISLNFKHR